MLCPECGNGGCNHMVQPGAAMPVALVCDLTASKKDYELLNILCNPDSELPVISALGFDPTTGVFDFKYYNQDGTDYTGATPVLCNRSYSYSSPFQFCASGVDITRTDVFLNDSNTPLFSIWQDKLGAIVPSPAINDIVSGWCTDTDYETYILCDAGNANKQFLRVVKFSTTILPVAMVDYDLDGTTPYTVVGPVKLCMAYVSSEFEILCDSLNSFVRRYDKDTEGNVSIVDTLFDGQTPYVVNGTVGICDSYISYESKILCDDNGKFLRTYLRTKTQTAIRDTFLDGITAYTPIGNVIVCVNDTLKCLTCRES